MSWLLTSILVLTGIAVLGVLFDKLYLSYHAEIKAILHSFGMDGEGQDLNRQIVDDLNSLLSSNQNTYLVSTEYIPSEQKFNILIKRQRINNPGYLNNLVYGAKFDTKGKIFFNQIADLPVEMLINNMINAGFGIPPQVIHPPFFQLMARLYKRSISDNMPAVKKFSTRERDRVTGFKNQLTFLLDKLSQKYKN